MTDKEITLCYLNWGIRQIKTTVYSPEQTALIDNALKVINYLVETIKDAGPDTIPKEH